VQGILATATEERVFLTEEAEECEQQSAYTRPLAGNVPKSSSHVFLCNKPGID